VFKLRDLATQFVHTASLSAAARLNTSIKSSAAVDRTQIFNPLLRTLKPQSNGYTMIGTMAPPSPLLAVPNVTAHPSTAIVPTSYCSMWHYNSAFSLLVGKYF